MDKNEICELRYRLIMATSNISKREQNTAYKCRDKTIHSILLNPIKWAIQGNNLYLYGTVGTGKTMTGTAILKQYAKKLSEMNVFPETPILYISLPDFLNECKRDIGREKDDLKTPQMVEQMKSADVVVMDEIGSIKALTEYERNVLFEIIDARIREMRSTIYTSNSDATKLRNALGEQLFSRVYNGSTKIEMVGVDGREG